MQLTAREKWGKPTFASASAFDPTPSEAQGQAASSALEIAGVAGTELGTVDNEKCLSGSFVETGFSAAGGGAPKPFKLMVVQAVRCEPVSRELTGQKWKIGRNCR